MTGGTELSSSFSEHLVRMQVRAFASIGTRGAQATATFIWSGKENPDALLLIVSTVDSAESYVFGHDLLRQGLTAVNPVGDGIVRCIRVNATVRIHIARISGEWLRINLAHDDVSRFVSAVDARMLNIERPDIETEWSELDSGPGGASATWMEPPC